jgi:hypothetical protein
MIVLHRHSTEVLNRPTAYTLEEEEEGEFREWQSVPS